MKFNYMSLAKRKKIREKVEGKGIERVEGKRKETDKHFK